MHALQARARLSSIGLLALVPFQPSAVTAINASIAQVPLSSQATSCSTALTKTVALASVYPVCLTLATAAACVQALLQNAHQQSSFLIHIEELTF